MSINVMDEYSKITIRQLNDYMKTILEDKYRRFICDEFSNVYINIRYNGLITPRRGLTVRNKLFQELKKKEIELVKENPKYQRTIEYTYLFYDDCAFFDTAHKQSEIKEKVEEILDIRREFFGEDKISKEDEMKFRLNFTLMVQMNTDEKNNFLKRFETKEFNLRYKNYKDNLQKVKITQNVKFPYIYSNEAIDNVFDSGVTLEDKLLVEYYLLSAKIIKDIEQSDYRKEYVVDFPGTLFDKETKLTRLLTIINNSTMQDRISLEITYKDFRMHREKIFDLVSQGYNFAMRIDDDKFDGNDAEIQSFSILKYVIMKKNIPSLRRLNNTIVIK